MDLYLFQMYKRLSVLNEFDSPIWEIRLVHLVRASVHYTNAHSLKLIDSDISNEEKSLENLTLTGTYWK